MRTKHLKLDWEIYDTSHVRYVMLSDPEQSSYTTVRKLCRVYHIILTSCCKYKFIMYAGDAGDAGDGNLEPRVKKKTLSKKKTPSLWNVGSLTPLKHTEPGVWDRHVCSLCGKREVYTLCRACRVGSETILLFERSKFLIATSPQKICACVVCSTNLGFSGVGKTLLLSHV